MNKIDQFIHDNKIKWAKGKWFTCPLCGKKEMIGIEIKTNWKVFKMCQTCGVAIGMELKDKNG